MFVGALGVRIVGATIARVNRRIRRTLCSPYSPSYSASIGLRHRPVSLAGTGGPLDRVVNSPNTQRRVNSWVRKSRTAPPCGPSVRLNRVPSGDHVTFVQPRCTHLELTPALSCPLLAELAQQAERHRTRGLNVPAALYELWLEALIEAVRECDPRCNRAIEHSWRLLTGHVIRRIGTLNENETKLVDA